MKMNISSATMSKGSAEMVINYSDNSTKKGR